MQVATIRDPASAQDIGEWFAFERNHNINITLIYEVCIIKSSKKLNYRNDDGIGTGEIFLDHFTYSTQSGSFFKLIKLQQILEIMVITIVHI